ncbi:MAG: hypothetical protein SNJ70_08900 [Armatimonadota bacterium]
MLGRNSFGQDKGIHCIWSALYCAIVALVLSYGTFYFLSSVGLGVLSTTDKTPATHSALVNLVSVHNANLHGEGIVENEMAGKSNITADIKLPITSYIFIPIIALLLAGYISSLPRADFGQLAMSCSAILGGIIYGVVISAASQFTPVKITSFIFENFRGFSFEAPQVFFTADLYSTLIFTVAVGALMSFLGAMIANRTLSNKSESGKWWTCAVSGLLCIVIIQVLIAGTIQYIVYSNADKEDIEQGNDNILNILPSVAGLSYVLMHGVTVEGAVESYMSITDKTQRPFGGSVNLYKGIVSVADSDEEPQKKPVPISLIITGIVLIAATFMIAGALAVKWGARWGSFPIALRIGFINAVYIFIASEFCSARISSTMKTEDFINKTTIYLDTMASIYVVFLIIAAFLFSFIGAWLTNRRYLLNTGYPSY